MDREIPKEQRMARKRRVIFAVSGCLAVLVAGVCVLFSLAKTGVSRADITLATVDTGMLEATVAASGKVVPAYEEIINSPIDTRVLEVFRRSGDRVEADAPLLALVLLSAQTEYDQMSDRCDMLRCQLEQMRLNNNTYLTDLEMRVNVKEMTVNRLAVDLRNEQYLDSLGSGSGDNVHQARLAYETGRMELEQLRKQLANERQVKDADLQVKRLELQVSEKSLAELRRTLDDAQVRAPRSGVLTYINNNIGERVPKGAQIAIIADLSRFKIECQMADSYADRLHYGGRVMVKAGRDMMEGTVSNIAPLSNGGVMAFTVQLENDSTVTLRSGLKADVYVLSNVTDHAVRLQKGPYYTGPGDYELFVAADDGHTAERRRVVLGASGLEQVEVKSGLNPGEQVIVSDMSNFRNSSRLKIKD